jgi:septal ring factor EnvC (AmiA/AmiB activator)
MLKLLSAALTAVVVLVACPPPAAAQRMPNLEQRVTDARERIARGQRNGDLTRGEAEGLRDDLARVERMMDRARRDGVATQGERQDIRDEVTRLEREIDRMLHNRRRR